MNNRCLLLLLLLVALMAVCVAGMQRDACDPDCTGMLPGMMVSDPTDCAKFYVCLADGLPSDESYSCLSGYFNPVTQDCSGTSPICPNLCTPKQCQMTCKTPPQYIADPKDCRKFYVCTGVSVLGPFDCPPENPLYGGTHCGNDSTKCCSDLCYPYCFEANVNIPDPLNCTMYYGCRATGAVEEGWHFPCPGGENFDIPSGECTSGASCTVLCGEADITTTPGVTGTATSDDGNASTPGVTPTSGCLASLTCTELGYFAQCPTCQHEYFRCTAIGQPAHLQQCTGNLVFNPDPAYPYCVLPTNCPYHPPI
ncbi:uncharacterized protein [Panulirus ornatus]|uniref:uncharacterized protein isoform X1 n=1 Tax=Panulirus ornatus TaxID=150431 RepID=UPI003A83BBBD